MVCFDCLAVHNNSVCGRDALCRCWEKLSFSFQIWICCVRYYTFCFGFQSRVALLFGLGVFVSFVWRLTTPLIKDSDHWSTRPSEPADQAAADGHQCSESDGGQYVYNTSINLLHCNPFVARAHDPPARKCYTKTGWGPDTKRFPLIHCLQTMALHCTDSGSLSNIALI